MFQDYLTSRERTTRWVQTHAPLDGDFYSPSVPPSHLDDAFVSSRPPSEAGSSRSTPPKMVLRYNDGRPDILINHPAAESGLSSTRHSRHGRSHSKHDGGHGRSSGRPVIPANDQVPEEIRILPSKTSSSLRHSHLRSKSLPRRIDYEREPHQRTVSPTQHKVTFAPPAQPSQPWHLSKQPSNSAYPHGQRPRYSSQQMYHSHQIGPNGVIYSHSAPPAGQYPPHFVAPSFHPSHRKTVHDADHRGRDFGRSGRYPAGESAESLGTEKTYFVLPAHGAHSKKVHVITPSPERSIMTATSTTAHTHTGKKPFFKRLFGKFSFSVS